MPDRKLNRRNFLGLAAIGVGAPAIMRASRVEAAEVSKMAGQLLLCGFPGHATAHQSTNFFSACAV